MNNSPHAFSQMLVGRYLLYGHDARAQCQAHRVEMSATTDAMDRVTAAMAVGVAKGLAFLIAVCSPLVLPTKFLLIEMTRALEKQHYDDPVGIALMLSPNAFVVLVSSFVLGLLSWLAVKGSKRLLKKGR